MISRRILIFICINSFLSSACFCQDLYQAAMKEYLNREYEKSIELFTKSIQNNQEVAKSYMMRGSARAYQGQFPEALSDLTFSKIIDSGNKKLDYCFCRFYLLKGEYDNALNFCNSAIFKIPNDADAYDLRASVEALKGDYSTAIVDEDTAIKINPSKQIFYNDRGFAKFKLNK